MKLHLRLLLIALVLMLGLPTLVAAQETTTADAVLTDVVLPRIEEYGAKLPKGYGTLNIADFQTMLAENEDVVILDVRETSEIEEFGAIEGSINIPLRTLGQNLNLLPNLKATIVVVCKGGFRGTIGMTALHMLGYENAKVLIGGFDAWPRRRTTGGGCCR
ncbi:MAG: rhodanese-like domain-containing protein [Anaerolineae bacterium]